MTISPSTFVHSLKKKICVLKEKMKKTVGCFTEEKLQELSEQSNTVVYKPTHDIVFEAWPASKVSTVMDEIVEITKSFKFQNDIINEVMKRPHLKEFSEKYTKMFDKLTILDFVSDHENIQVMKRLILLKAAVEQNMTTEESAQAQVSDIALKSLSSRVKNAK